MGEPRTIRAARIVLTTALLLGLVAYAWHGWYTRYVTDDYCTAGMLRTIGFVDSMRQQRALWSGRYSYYAIKAALESIGPITPRVVPGVLVVLLAAAAAWAVRKGLAVSVPASIAAALAIAFADVDATPEVFNLFGPFAWETGAVTYMLPVVLFTVWIALLCSATSLAIACTAGAALLFVAGGLSETSLAAQGVMCGGALVLALLHRNRPITWIAGSGLAATIASLAIMFSAPGNAVRASMLPPRRPLWDVAAMTARLTFDDIGSHLFVEGVALVVVIAAGILCGATMNHARRTIALQTALLAYLCAASTFLPSAWALSSGPPARALQVTTFFAVVAVFAASTAIRCKPQWLVALLVVAAIFPIRAAVRVVDEIPDARRNAATIDSITVALQSANEQRVVLRSRWALEERFLYPDPTHWTNRCVAMYFGLQSVRVERR